MSISQELRIYGDELSECHSGHVNAALVMERAADEIERLTAALKGSVAVPADTAAAIEQCAKIAEPWAGFWLDKSSTEADRAVVAVRAEIAVKIRAFALLPHKCGGAT